MQESETEWDGMDLDLHEHDSMTLYAEGLRVMMRAADWRRLVLTCVWSHEKAVGLELGFACSVPGLPSWLMSRRAWTGCNVRYASTETETEIFERQ